MMDLWPKMSIYEILVAGGAAAAVAELRGGVEGPLVLAALGVPTGIRCTQRR
jgi:hypothetical protein